MFHIYWPVIALVGAVVLVAILVTLRLTKACGVRFTAPPERPLRTYLPESDNDAMFDAVAHSQMPVAMSEMRSAAAGGGGGSVQGGGSIIGDDFEPHSNLDASMSPEGRRDFGVDC